MKTNIEEINEYMKTLSDKSAHTVRSYEGSLSVFLEKMNIVTFEDLNISTKVARQYVRDIAEVNTNSTANARLRVIKAMYNWMVENEYLDKNPFTGVKFLKEGKKVPTILTETERDMVLDACYDIGEKLMIAMMIYAGLRREEVTNVKVEDVKDGKVLIKGKGNKERVLPLNDYVLNIFSEYMKTRKSKSEYLFVSHKGDHQITGQSVRLRVKRICEVAKIDEAKIEKISSHDLRRTFAVDLLEKNISMPIIQKALGHSSQVTTALYLRGAGNSVLDNILTVQTTPKEK